MFDQNKSLSSKFLLNLFAVSYKSYTGQVLIKIIIHHDTHNSVFVLIIKIFYNLQSTMNVIKT